MRFFSLNRGLTKAAPANVSAVPQTGGSWWPLIREAFAGAWQRNMEWSVDSVLAHHAVYACVTLIASDLAKLHPKLMQRRADGIWVEDPGAMRVLARPNRFQNWLQFAEWWALSKLLRGNAYALKERAGQEIVGLHLLDTTRVTVLVSTNGSVFYQLQTDNLAGLESAVVVPASEIIHDRMNCLFHPLVGVSPIFACGAAANVGLKIQNATVNFFGKGSNPSGILTAPGVIDQATADRLAEQWNRNFAGDNAGKVAVLGDGLKFEPMQMSAVDSQTIEHLKWSAETVCSAFHVPPFKIGAGTMPTYQNAEILNQVYYSDCLQAHIEAFEAVLDEGLGFIGPDGKQDRGVELDVDDLLRMDTETQYLTLGNAIKNGLMAPNEGRAKIGLLPKKGGDTPYLQQQNYSLAALDERDQANPLGPKQKPPKAPPPELPPPKGLDLEALAEAFVAELRAA